MSNDTLTEVLEAFLDKVQKLTEAHLVSTAAREEQVEIADKLVSEMAHARLRENRAMAQMVEFRATVGELIADLRVHNTLLKEVFKDVTIGEVLGFSESLTTLTAETRKHNTSLQLFLQGVPISEAVEEVLHETQLRYDWLAVEIQTILRFVQMAIPELIKIDEKFVGIGEEVDDLLDSKKSIMRRIEITQTALDKLEEQKAAWGMDVPPHLDFRIEFYKQQLSDLRSGLK